MQPTDAVESWGYFDDEAGAFVLTDPRPPRHWKNILFNARYNAQPTQSGAGISYRRDDDGTIVLLNWSGEKAFYVRDEETGDVFCPGYWPVCNDALDRFACRFGRGTHRIEQRCNGLAVSLDMVVPVEGCVEILQLVVRNETPRPRRLSFTAFFDIDLNCGRSDLGSMNRYTVSADETTLCIRNTMHRIDREWNACLAASAPIESFCFDRSDFLGPFDTLARPTGVAASLPNELDEPDNPVMAARWRLDVSADGEQTLDLAFGNAVEAAGIPGEVAQWVQPGRFEEAMRGVADEVARREAALRVATQDANFDRFVNLWLPQQVSYCAQWNRGWGKGFRDGMQDAWAYALIDPAYVRLMIVDALPHQYADGRTLRKWAPIDRDEYNDGPAWLAMAAYAYVAQTGDVDFLRTEHGFFESDDRGTVLEHLRRGMTTLYEQRGERGLCLMPYGDWNDQLTGPGAGGKGESVWTTMALAAALPKVAALARRAGDLDLASFCDAARDEVAQALRANAWTGRWFARATCDDGSLIGHPDNEFGRIFLLPQAWALLADIPDDAQRDALLSAVDEHLSADHGYLLMTPPWTRYDASAGEISLRRAGTIENGANYCHGSTFMIAALCRAGRKDRALDVFRRVLPTNPLNPPSRSGQEPFSITNSYRGPVAGRSAGRSMFSWRTGAAGWMYRVAVEELLGVRAELDGLHVDRALPAEWSQATLHRRYRGRDVTVQFKRTGRERLSVAGQEIDGPLVPADLIEQGTEIVCEL